MWKTAQRVASEWSFKKDVFTYRGMRAASLQWSWLWIQGCLTSNWLDDCKSLMDLHCILLNNTQHNVSVPPGGLYRLSHLIHKASQICLLFIFPELLGFAWAGKLPFSGSIFPRRNGSFLLLLMESNEHSQESHCYPRASLHAQVRIKRTVKNTREHWQLCIRRQLCLCCRALVTSVKNTSLYLIS